MLWTTPNGKHIWTAALEKRRQAAANQTRANFGLIYLCLVALLTAGSVHAADTPARRQWTVDDVVREALVYAPTSARTNAAPVVFAFHGHGGSMQNAARMFSFHTRWPEAIVVYMQGLNTPGRLTDPEGQKPGWQSGVGDQGDRDLKFFDTVLASLKQDYRVDTKRIYAPAIPTAAASRICSGRRAARHLRPSLHPQRQPRELCLSSNPSPCCTSPAQMTRWSNSSGSNERWPRCGN